jgi:hypothetical protein
MLPVAFLPMACAGKNGGVPNDSCRSFIVLILKRLLICIFTFVYLSGKNDPCHPYAIRSILVCPENSKVQHPFYMDV